LILHVLGNLPVLWDPVAFNGYAHFLQSNPPLLWTERVLVFGAMVVHAWMGIRLTRMNRAARASRYVERAKDTSTFSSRTMIVSGLIILAFFVYHILHFTVRGVGGATFGVATLPNGETANDAALMVRTAFANPAIAAFYVVGQLLLFSHLYHGSVSLFQSFGLYKIFRHLWVRRIAKALVLAMVAGAISIPVILFLRARA
jgi:succinate dehydrogenase / fumarate reductase cytochrome b subunit